VKIILKSVKTDLKIGSFITIKVIIHVINNIINRSNVSRMTLKSIINTSFPIVVPKHDLGFYIIT